MASYSSTATSVARGGAGPVQSHNPSAGPQGAVSHTLPWPQGHCEVWSGELHIPQLPFRTFSTPSSFKMVVHVRGTLPQPAWTMHIVIAQLILAAQQSSMVVYESSSQLPAGVPEQAPSTPPLKTQPSPPLGRNQPPVATRSTTSPTPAAPRRRAASCAVAAVTARAAKKKVVFMVSIEGEARGDAGRGGYGYRNGDGCDDTMESEVQRREEAGPWMVRGVASGLLCLRSFEL